MSELDDLMPTSPDHNAARLAELKRLFPDLFSDEGRLDVKAVRKLADPDMLDMEKFRFTWYGKSRARRKAFAPSKGALVYDAERSVNPELADGNMIIEGENLEVLKLLTSAYSEKVKCIYIDPPYNTGNDFIYPDNYAQGKKEYWEQNGIFKDGVKMDSNPESNGRFHSDWLSMMFSRLLVARLLLKEDGVIFVSIDDHEVHNLRKLMDEVFGEENFVELISWKNKYGAGAKTKGFISVHEYILCYSKMPIQTLESTLTKEQIAEYKLKDKKFPTRGGFVTQPLMTNSLGDRKNLQYPIKHKGEVIYPRKQWVWGKERLLTTIQDDGVVFKKKKNGEWSVRAKHYLKNMDGEIRKGKPLSLLNGPFTQEGTKELETIFATDIFPFPKPSSLIKYFFSFAVNGNDEKDGLYMDFFSGSGATGQALMRLNNEDGGNRKFILVQIPEAIEKQETAYKAGYKKISDITIERVKRVITGHGETPNLFGTGHETGFKVYRLAESRFPRVTFQSNPDKSMEENVAALKQHIVEVEANMWLIFERDAVFDEVLLKHGFQLNYTLEKQDIFTHNDVFLARTTGKEMLICLDTFLQEETVAHFKTNRDPFFLCLERGLNTDKKWALKHYLGERLKTI